MRWPIMASMPLLMLSNVRHAYGSRTVLDRATLAIEPGEKVGLVGRNGSGKTTLMKVITGHLTPDAGSSQLQRGARVGYLSQDPTLDPNDTVRDAAEGAFAELHALHVKANELYERMATADGDALERLLKQQATIDAKIEAAGGYAIDHKIEATLHGLGFTDAQFTLKVAKLSGGQKNRLGLARLLLESPDVLLLDEPTNHLDIAGREWLENFLAEEYLGAVIVVSHDRWLLDRVVSRIIEVERGMIREYPGNYQKYLELRHERQLTAARVFDKQQDKIRQEEQFIRRYKTGQRAKQARGRQSRLDRFKRDEVTERPIELDVMRLRLPKPPRSGDQVVWAEGLGKRYGELTLFDDFNITVMRGDRIGIIGPNGVGKTTLVRCLLGDLEHDEGEVRLGSRLNIGYYRQLHDGLDTSLTVCQYLQSVILGEDDSARGSEQQARDLAGAFLFSGSEQDKVLAELSGGERSRAVLAGLVASAKNLLVLDEPTNHLDIPSAERLEAALGEYDGTLLLITHDRALLQATCDQLLVFDGQGYVHLFQGTFSEWSERQRSLEKPETTKKSRSVLKPAKNGDTKPVKSSGNRIKSIEQRIEQLEHRLNEIDRELSDPTVFVDGQRTRTLQKQRSAVAAELEPLEAEWSRLVDEV